MKKKKKTPSAMFVKHQRNWRSLLILSYKFRIRGTLYIYIYIVEYFMDLSAAQEKETIPFYSSIQGLV
jgi:hypothetical protein